MSSDIGDLSNPAYILRLIRDGKDGWESITEHFRQSLRAYPSALSILNGSLNRLQEAGLIESKKNSNGEQSMHVSRQWSKIQNVLGISLTNISLLAQDGSFIVTPFFGPISTRIKNNDVFVVMPFQPELQPVYEDHILAVCKALEISVARADDFFSANSVMHDIWMAIAGSKIVIADCTGKNPNVFYEIGIAHTVGRTVILITQNPEDVPFDLRHVRYIHYSLTPRGMAAFEETLKATLMAEFELMPASKFFKTSSLEPPDE